MGKRMYYIFKIILESQTVISAQNILKELENYDIYIDIKSIYSHVQRINEFFKEWIGYDIIIAVRRTGYKINKDFFNDGEIQFLLDSIHFHKDLNQQDQQLMIKKILSLSSFIQQQRLIHHQNNHQNHSFSLIHNLSTLMKAIENKTVIGFQYINYEVENHHLKEVPSLKGNHKDLYFVSPYQLVLQNNHYYLIAYNNKYKNELRLYRVDRMRLLHSIRKQFIEIREQFDMQEEIEKMTNMFISHKRDTVELECEYSVLREIVSRFGQDIFCEKQNQNTYHIIIQDVALSQGFVGWLLMLQDQVKVLAPYSLQLEMKTRIEKISCLYENVI